MDLIKVYIYGAGAEYRRLSSSLKNFGDKVEILGIVTTESQGFDSLDGYPVIRPSEIKQEEMDYIIIAIVEWRDIVKTLSEYGISTEQMLLSRMFCEKRYYIEEFLQYRKKSKEEKKTTKLPIVRIWCEDWTEGTNMFSHSMMRELREHIFLDYNPINPDFVFSSVFGNHAMEYDAVRIIYTSEDYLPDFNYFDYVIGYDYIQYEDRYLRWPHYKLYDAYEAAKEKHNKVDMQEFMKRDFCCRVVSNDRCELRERVFEIINAKKRVASGGKSKNNLQPPVPVKDKKEFLSGYKFNLAFENNSSNGYLTEKLIQAWEAGCIPIYWGDPLVAESFNEEAFVNCDKFNSEEELVEYILELEQSPERMEKMLRAPILERDIIDYGETMTSFLVKIMSQEKERAYRRKSYFSCRLYALNKDTIARVEQASYGYSLNYR